jgi:2,3-bisphosphoglycerate-independent phosphoglycerate mutase
MPDSGEKQPAVLVVMDGWGHREAVEHNGIRLADPQCFNRLWREWPHGLLRTDGLNVGLPKGTMGNSEVGHLNLGAGRVVWQDVMSTAVSVMDGSFENNQALLGAIRHAQKTGGRVHLYGLVSSALIHSCDEVYGALIRLCARHGLLGNRTVFHVFTDGRDTPPKSGEVWTSDLQRKLELYGTGVVGVVSGRYYAMDRDKRWERVEKAWKALVDGDAEFTARSAIAAIQAG